MLDLVMKGEIVAETDISVSPPDHSMKEGRATVMTLPEKGVWRGGDFVTTVYLPGSSIRGALRNGAARALAAERAARQSPMTPDSFLLIAKGGIKDRKETGRDERVVDHEAAARLRHEQPIVSLFGAMTQKIVGRWQIGDAVPVEPLTKPNRKGRGVRSHPFQRQPELAAFMDESAYRDFLGRDRKRVEANIAEDEAERLGKKIARERKASGAEHVEDRRMGGRGEATERARQHIARGGGWRGQRATGARWLAGDPGRHEDESPNEASRRHRG